MMMFKPHFGLLKQAQNLRAFSASFLTMQTFGKQSLVLLIKQWFSYVRRPIMARVVILHILTPRW